MNLSLFYQFFMRFLLGTMLACEAVYVGLHAPEISQLQLLAAAFVVAIGHEFFDECVKKLGLL